MTQRVMAALKSSPRCIDNVKQKQVVACFETQSLDEPFHFIIISIWTIALYLCLKIVNELCVLTNVLNTEAHLEVGLCLMLHIQTVYRISLPRGPFGCTGSRRHLSIHRHIYHPFSVTSDSFWVSDISASVYLLSDEGKHLLVFIANILHTYMLLLGRWMHITLIWPTTIPLSFALLIFLSEFFLMLMWLGYKLYFPV